MPDIGWLIKRLKVMSLKEILIMRLWRTGRDALWKPGRRIPPDLSLTMNLLEEDSRLIYESHFSDGINHTIEAAERLMENRIVLFGREIQFADPPDWLRDPITGNMWPLGRIDYRSSRVGDPKDVWELNRHQFLPVLGKASWITGEERYGRKAIDWMESWMDQNPPYSGINWASGIELALRAFSWLQTLNCLYDSSLLNEERMTRLTGCLYRHGCWIDSHLSLFSSANNHLISELFALSTLGHAMNRKKWISRGLSILSDQIDSQVLADGVGAEQSLSYLKHTLEYSALALLVCRRREMEMPRKVLQALERGGRFLRSMMRDDGSLPFIGDSDSGRVMDMGKDFESTGTLLNLIAVLTGNDGLMQANVLKDEALFWLLGASGFVEVSRKAVTAAPEKGSKFPNGGIFILERIFGDDRIRAVFDCGPLGLPPLAGHGHADALSFVLDVNGEAVLIDPGTFTYFKSRFWRDYFRGTSAHNTVRIDGLDQSVFGGPFLALQHNQAECREWISGSKVSGRSFGYQRLESGVVHTRSLELLSEKPGLKITDVLETEGRHQVEVFFHLAPGIHPFQESNPSWSADLKGKELRLELDPKLTWEDHFGDEETPSGWASPVYGLKERVHTLIGRTGIEETECFTSEINLIYRDGKK